MHSDATGFVRLPALRRLWPKSADKREQRGLAGLFLLPDIIGLSVFWALPVLYLFVLSFCEWTGLGDRTYVGIQNYSDLYRDPLFWKSLRVTLTYFAAYVPLVVVCSLALAVLLNRQIRGRNWFRTAFFVPYALPMVIAGVIWVFMLDPAFGLFNYVLRQILDLPFLSQFGWELPNRMWLLSTTWALPVIIWVGLWKYVGFYMLLFLAGLQDIPPEYYEAAMIDGANSRRVFWDITLPLLRPVVFFVFLITAFRAFQVFGQVYVMTRGGPFNATYTTMYFIYEAGFRYYDFGYGAAASVVLFFMVLAFTLVQARFFGLRGAH
jgi:multiple sugar transport system permease protein